MIHGEELPVGVAVGPDGLPTRDPHAAFEGAISPLGGHKGFGLGLCIALLSGPLVGAAVGNGLKGWLLTEPGPAASKGHLFAAIDPIHFGDSATFRKRVSAYLDEIRSSHKAPGVTAIRIPGERAFVARTANLRRGSVSVHEVVWARTATVAAELGVTMPG